MCPIHSFSLWNLHPENQPLRKLPRFYRISDDEFNSWVGSVLNFGHKATISYREGKTLHCLMTGESWFIIHVHLKINDLQFQGSLQSLPEQLDMLECTDLDPNPAVTSVHRPYYKIRTLDQTFITFYFTNLPIFSHLFVVVIAQEQMLLWYLGMSIPYKTI